MKIDKDQVEQIGQLADMADNLVYAAKLPLPAEMHVEQLVNGLEGLREGLRIIYCYATNTNPWED